MYGSLVELIQGGAGGLSVLRTFRLLRILKLVRFLPALQYQLKIMLRTLDNVPTFLALLVLFIFIFRFRRFLVADRVNAVGNAIASVRPSVCPFVSKINGQSVPKIQWKQTDGQRLSLANSHHHHHHHMGFLEWPKQQRHHEDHYVLVKGTDFAR